MDRIPDYQTISSMSDAELTQLFGVRDIFTYTINFASLANAANATGQFTIEADSNFLWQEASYQADVALAAVTDSSRIIPLVNVTIQDSGSGRQLMNTATPIPNIFGTGELPFLLPTPRFFRAQTTVSINVSNYSTATTYNLRLSFIGTKFFKFNTQQG